MDEIFVFEYEGKVELEADCIIIQLLHIGDQTLLKGTPHAQRIAGRF